MPDIESFADRPPVRREIERDVIYALTPWDGERPLWSLDELAREAEEPDVSIPVEILCHVGLVHRTPDGLVFASPAAVYLIEQVGHVI